MSSYAKFDLKDANHLFNKLSNFYDANLVKNWQKNISSILDNFFIKYNINNYIVNKDSYMGLLLDCGDYYIKAVPPMINRFEYEIGTLQKMPKVCICKIFDIDYDNKVFVMERIKPGVKAEFNINKTQLSDLFNNLYINRIDFDQKHKDFSDIVTYDYSICKHVSPSEVVDKLYNIFIKNYNELDGEKFLLHGDLYKNNILKSNNGLKVVDPLGFNAPYIIEYTPICAYEMYYSDGNYEKIFNDFVYFFGNMIDKAMYKKALLCQLIKVYIPSNYEANDGGKRAKKWLDIINTLYKGEI